MSAIDRLRRTVRRGGAAFAVAAVVVTATSCSVREDASPRPLVGIGVFGASATGDAAVGANRIYLLTATNADGQRRLRSVPRDVTGGADELIRSLLSGPNNDEVENSLGTAIPSDLQLNSVSAVGTRLTIDIGDGLAELSDEAIRLALAQIVATASELEGVERVRIRVDGENRAWPTGDGRLTDEALSVYDYPGYLESSQPAFPALSS